MNGGGKLGCQPGVQIRIDGHEQQRVSVDGLDLPRAVRLQDLDLDRLGGQLVRDVDDVAGEVGCRRRAEPTGAVRGQRGRQGSQHVRVIGVGKLRRDDRVEQQPLHVVRVGERVRHRQLGAVGRAPEGHLVGTERQPHRLEVLGGLVRAVEVARCPDAGCARGNLLAFDVDVERRRALESRAPQHARVARAAVVVCDERVAREEVAVERGIGRRAEPEDVCGALTGAAGDEEDRPACDPERGQGLDVERDRARHDARAVERDDDSGAEEARRVSAGRAGRGRLDARDPGRRVREQQEPVAVYTSIREQERQPREDPSSRRCRRAHLRGARPRRRRGRDGKGDQQCERQCRRVPRGPAPDRIDHATLLDFNCCASSDPSAA